MVLSEAISYTLSLAPQTIQRNWEGEKYEKTKNPRPKDIKSRLKDNHSVQKESQKCPITQKSLLEHSAGKQAHP